jgi:endonuclease/exonuclease/phosphatase (EEP) superfamily protein YafD
MIDSLAVVFNRKSATSSALSLWGLTAAAAAVVATCSIIGFAARLGWPFELASHFRLQYAVALFACSIAFTFRRRFTSAALLLAAVLINLIPVLPYLSSKSMADLGAAPTLRLLLVNVRSENIHASRVLDVVEKTAPDVVLLQETTTWWMDELEKLGINYPHSVSEPREDNFGIALFSRLPLERAEIVYLGDAEVPSIDVEFLLGEQRVLLVGTHPVPPASPSYFKLRNGQLRAVGIRVLSWPGPAIVLGDLNTTPYSPVFIDLLRVSRLRDTADNFRVQGTWPSTLPPLRIPLDHCLVSSNFIVLHRQIGHNVGSDHLPLSVTLALP